MPERHKLYVHGLEVQCYKIINLINKSKWHCYSADENTITLMGFRLFDLFRVSIIC